MLRMYRYLASFLLLTLLVPATAEATITNVLPVGVIVSPLPFDAVRSSDHSNTPTGDIGAQNPANVEAKLESAAWLGVPLTFVGGGACGASPGFANNCSAFENDTDGKGGTSNLTANVFGIHFGDNFIAVLYADAVSGFSISGLSNGVSNIYAFNTNTVSQVPLPAALPLFFAALSLLGLGGWLQRRRATA